MTFGLCGLHVDLGLSQVGLAGRSIRFPRGHGGLRGVSRGDARIELSLRLGEHLFVDDLFLHHLRQTFYLGLPANDFRLILSHVRFCFGQLGDCHLDIALGHHHQLLGLLDQPFVQLDLRHLSLMVFVQFGDENLRQQIALFHLLADVHVEVLDEPGHLRENRGLLEGVHKARLVDRVVDGPQLRLDDADHGLAAAGAFCFACSLSP